MYASLHAAQLCAGIWIVTYKLRLLNCLCLDIGREEQAKQKNHIPILLAQLWTPVF